MRHYQNTIRTYSSETTLLMEQVFKILDSRIQFIDFQVQCYFNSCTSEFNENLTNQTVPSSSASNSLVNNLDQILRDTEKLQNDLKILQMLKAWLKEETVQDILDLLTNNKYLSFSQENIEYLLKQKVLMHHKLEAV